MLSWLSQQSRRRPGHRRASLVAQVIKNLPVMRGDQSLIPGLGRSPGEGNGFNHSSILTWRIRWTEKPGRLQSMGLHWVRHDWAANTCIPAHTSHRREREPTWLSTQRKSVGPSWLQPALMKQPRHSYANGWEWTHSHSDALWRKFTVLPSFGGRLCSSSCLSCLWIPPLLEPLNCGPPVSAKPFPASPPSVPLWVFQVPQPLSTCPTPAPFPSVLSGLQKAQRYLTNRTLPFQSRNRGHQVSQV